jgi:peptidoglycan hydrolase CwlO-like protein
MPYQANTSDQDKTRQRNDLQCEMIMKSADLKKILSGKVKLDAEIRSLKKERERATLEIQGKEKQIEKIDQEARMVEIEIKNLKKKMNLL